MQPFAAADLMHVCASRILTPGSGFYITVTCNPLFLPKAFFSFFLRPVFLDPPTSSPLSAKAGALFWCVLKLSLPRPGLPPTNSRARSPAHKGMGVRDVSQGMMRFHQAWSHEHSYAQEVHEVSTGVAGTEVAQGGVCSGRGKCVTGVPNTVASSQLILLEASFYF